MGETVTFILVLRVVLKTIRAFIFAPFFLCGVVSGVLFIAFIHWWKTAPVWYVGFLVLVYAVVMSNVLSWESWFEARRRSLLRREVVTSVCLSGVMYISVGSILVACRRTAFMSLILRFVLALYRIFRLRRWTAMMSEVHGWRWDSVGGRLCVNARFKLGSECVL